MPFALIGLGMQEILLLGLCGLLPFTAIVTLLIVLKVSRAKKAERPPREDE